MGNAIPKPTCNSTYVDNPLGCSNNKSCYYIDKRCNDRVEFYKITDIPLSYIKCSIYPDTNKSSNYILYCINTHKIKNIIIKSVQINNCNSLYRSNCNILLPVNIENNESALKPYMQTFGGVDGELTKRLNLTLDQVNLIKQNNNQITLIDIFDIVVNFTVEMYDRNFEQTFSPDKDMLNQNISNMNKTIVNLKALGLNNQIVS